MKNAKGWTNFFLYITTQNKTVAPMLRVRVATKIFTTLQKEDTSNVISFEHLVESFKSWDAGVQIGGGYKLKNCMKKLIIKTNGKSLVRYIPKNSFLTDSIIEPPGLTKLLS